MSLSPPPHELKDIGILSYGGQPKHSRYNAILMRAQGDVAHHGAAFALALSVGFGGTNLPFPGDELSVLAPFFLRIPDDLSTESSHT